MLIIEVELHGEIHCNFLEYYIMNLVRLSVTYNIKLINK